MRKLLFVFIALMMLAPAAQAASNGPVAVVDVPKVIRDCDGGKQVRDKLKAEFKDTQTQMDSQKAELDTMAQEMQKQSLVLSQEAKVDKEIEFKRKVRDYQDAMRNFQRKFKAEESKLSQPLLETVVETLKAYGKAHKLGMILDAKVGVLYADDAADVTNEIIVEVNKAWKAKK